jgi:hypothetical protein
VAQWHEIGMKALTHQEYQRSPAAQTIVATTSKKTFTDEQGFFQHEFNNQRGAAQLRCRA